MGRSAPIDFYDFIKKTLNLKEIIEGLEKQEACSADETEKLEGLKKIRGLIESDNFLVRSHSGKNGVIKHQLHYQELETIIGNLCTCSSKYKAFFEQSDGEYTNREKIESIFKFKIPYYVGPLDRNPNNKNHWAVRRSNEKITPWNWEKVVDKEKSAEEFIKRMISDCSYLPNAKALPRNSLLYEKFTTLNELNKIAIKSTENDEEQPSYLSEDLKNYALSLYKEKGTLTIKKLQDKLREKTGLPILTLVRPNGNPIDRNGFELSANMKAYADFQKILKRPVKAQDEEIVEEMILVLTLFEDKAMLRTQIEEDNKRYGSLFTNEQLDQITNLRYQGWGKLSRELLEDIKGNYQGQKVSLIQMLEKVVKKDGKDYSYNFMELLNDPSLGFAQAIEEKKVDAIGGEYKGFRDYVENSYNSPMIKRAIIQAMAIIKEVEKILGRPADRYFLESTRSPDASKKGKNGNKWARINQLTDAYEHLKKEIPSDSPWKNDFDVAFTKLQEIKNSRDWTSLRSKKLFLYFLQMGKDVYTGKTIPFESIYNNTSEYDIDHIIPQSMIKDDSLNNIVLVSITINQQVKKDIYPIPEKIIAAGKTTIQFLKDLGLLSVVKYNRLMRRNSLTESELQDFINRQLIATSQSVKGLRDTLTIDALQELKEKHPDWNQETVEKNLPEILYPKARNVSDFRHEFDIFKCREVNDFHHAHDAYLNIVVGDCYREKFGYRPSAEWRNEVHKQHSTTNFGKIFDDTIYNAQNKLVWIPDGKKKTNPSGQIPTIKIVKSQLNYTDILFTRRLKEQQGGLFDQTIYSPSSMKNKDDGSYVPLKGKTNKDKRLALLSDMDKYGYFNTMSVSHYCLVESKIAKGEAKGKTEYFLIPIPKIANTKKLIDQYIDSLKLKESKIIIRKLLTNTVCETFDSQDKAKTTRFSITAKTGKSYKISPMSQPHVPANITYFCQLLAKYKKEKALTSRDGRNPFYTIKENTVSFRSNNGKDNNGNDKRTLDIEKPSYDQCQEINLNVIKAVYDYVVSQLGKPIYSQNPISRQYSKIRKRLIEAEEEFLSKKSIDEQITLLSSCLEELQCRSSQGADFSCVNLSKQTGVLKLGQKLPPCFRIITQSITGFHEKVIFELDEHGERVELDEKKHDQFIKYGV